MFLANDKAKPYICAIYCRLSDQEASEVSKYDSIEAQRDICERYVKLREEQGWTLVRTKYDDRNVSGGKLERPALRRLLADARQGKFNMVVTKSVDRFTRSLKHFYELWDILRGAGIELASATQEFNTATSTGRLHLDIVLRFAQYERELASERTKQKMEYRARQGLYHGGFPLLGLDFHPSEKGVLKINRKEVPLARRVFQKYAEVQSAQLVARFLNRQGHHTKTWKTRAGAQRGGQRFTKAGVLTMLKNLAYIGRTGTAKESYKAQWRGIINLKLFNRVQHILQSNRVRKASISQNKHQFLLAGLVWCKRCGSQMTPNPAHSKGRTYLYYKCSKVIHADKTACSVRSVPARALERLVLDRIAFLAAHPTMVEAIVSQAVKAAKKNLPLLRRERAEIQGQLTKIKNKADVLVKAFGRKRFSFIKDQLDPLEEQRAALELRLSEIEEKLERERQKTVSPEVVVASLKHFAEVFDHLPFERQRDLLHLVVSKISYNDHPERVIVSYHHLPDIEPPKHPKNGHFGGSLLRRFDRRMYWLRALATHCTATDPAWWQSFPVYQTIDKHPTRRGGTGRRIVFQWTPPPVVPERVYTSPLLEARRYAGILKRDPFVKTQADLAREMGVSRVRITQVMSLLRLAPEIQERLLHLTDQPAIRFFSENRLRPLTQIADPARQREEFQKLLTQAPK